MPGLLGKSIMIQEDVPSFVWSLVIYYLCWTLIVRAELLQKSTHTHTARPSGKCLLRRHFMQTEMGMGLEIE